MLTGDTNGRWWNCFPPLALWVVAGFGCTQNDLPSSAQLSGQADERALMPASQVFAVKEQGSAQSTAADHPKPSSGVIVSDINFMQADTDGDKALDAVAICQNTKVCISRGRTNEQIIYSEPAWVSVRILDVQDTDGRDGAEVILQAFDGEGLLVCLCVIHDADRSIASYQDTGWKSVTVHAVEDTDGLAGREIVFLAKDPLGALRCLCVIHDRSRDVQSYQDWEWSSVKSLWFEDTDGKSGMEVVLEVQNSVEQLSCICIIHDATQRVMKYSNSSWIDGRIILLTDTNGQTGTEIVIGYRSSFGSGIAVIHDGNETIRTYTFRGELPAIQHVGPSSRHKGNDLCVLVERDELVILADRYEQPVPVETCDQGVHSPSGPSVHKGLQLLRPSV